MRAVTLLFACLVFIPAFGGEFLECKDSDPSADWDDILIKLYTGDEEISPSIRVEPVTQKARFTTVGDQRRWDWPLHYIEEGKPGYSVVLAANGQAEYYDFTRVGENESAGPHRRFECRPIQDRKPSGPLREHQ